MTIRLGQGRRNRKIGKPHLCEEERDFSQMKDPCEEQLVALQTAPSPNPEIPQSPMTDSLLLMFQFS